MIIQAGFNGSYSSVSSRKSKACFGQVFGGGLCENIPGYSRSMDRYGKRINRAQQLEPFHLARLYGLYLTLKDAIPIVRSVLPDFGKG